MPGVGPRGRPEPTPRETAVFGPVGYDARPLYAGHVVPVARTETGFGVSELELRCPPHVRSSLEEGPLPRVDHQGSVLSTGERGCRGEGGQHHGHLTAPSTGTPSYGAVVNRHSSLATGGFGACLTAVTLHR